MRSTLTTGLVRLAKHSVIAMPVSVVAAVLGAIPIGIVLKILQLGRVRGANPWYGPVVWWPGLFLGFYINRRTLQRAACFVWLPGLLWLTYGILTLRSHGLDWEGVRVALFPFKEGECGMSECLYVLLHTWPAVNSIAYSIGAALGLVYDRKSKNNKSGEPFIKHSTLGLD